MKKLNLYNKINLWSKRDISQRHILYGIVFMAMLFTGAFAAAPAPVYADTPPLVVDFESDPLFDVENFLPGDEVSKEVIVTNNSDNEQNVIVEAINVTDDDGLGSKLWLMITQNLQLYNDNFGTFLSNGEVPLSVLPAGETANYTFTVSFIGDADNNYQGKSLGFDLCIGFEGGTTNCGDTIVGGEGGFTESEGGEGGSEGDGSGSSDSETVLGSGGGGGGGSIGPIKIIGESNAVIVNDTSVVITWTTNYVSTSQVVYSSSSEPHELNLNDPLYGYAHGQPVPERSNKVINHSETLTGLLPGTTYFYRVISRASPPTISKERSFTTGGTRSSPYTPSANGSSSLPQAVQSLAFGAGNNAAESDTGSGGSNTNVILAGGIEGGGVGLGPEDIAEEEQAEEVREKAVPQNAAAAFFSFPETFSDWLKYIIIVILVIIVAYIIFLKRKSKI